MLGFTATPPAEVGGQWLLLPQPAAVCQVPPGLQRAVARPGPVSPEGAG